MIHENCLIFKVGASLFYELFLLLLTPTIKILYGVTSNGLIGLLSIIKSINT